MPQLYQLWKIDTDPDDPANGYSPYSFIPAGHTGVANMSMGRDFARREGVISLPATDGVLDNFGRTAAPMERRDQTFSFRRFTGGDNDAAYDALMAWLAPGDPLRLVALTDQDAQWFTVGHNPRVSVTETSAGNWGRDGYVDFAISWRIRPYWTPRFSETAEVFASTQPVFAADNHETFGSRGVTSITSATQAISVDARGTAGLDLPTLPDTAPVITITGPAGGAGGLLLLNSAAATYAPAGGKQNVQIALPAVPSGQTLVADCGAQRFTLNGVAFRPSRPVQQRVWFEIVPGVLNGLTLFAVGASPTTGGNIKIDFWRRKA